LNGAKHHSRLVVVEGELDCIAANTMLEGIADAVAIGMLTLTQQQVEAAKRAGYSSFTLCLDSDAENNHAKETTQAIQLLMKNGINEIYIVDLSTFGGEKIDPAALRLQPKGKEKFIAAFKNAKPFTEYMVEGIAEKYANERSPEGELLERAKNEMLREIYATAPTIPAMENRERFTNLAFKYFQEDGINFKTFQNTIENHAREREDAARQHVLKRFNEQLKEAVEEGNMVRVGELTKAIQAIATTAATTTFPKPYSMEQWKHELQNQAPLLKTGWEELDAIVGFPAGGLSIIAGRPSHGKTSSMLNSIVRNVGANPTKTFVYFNYEEPRAKIAAKMVNLLAGVHFGVDNMDKTAKGKTNAMPAEMKRRFNIDYIEWVAVHGNDPDVAKAVNTLEEWMRETDGNPARLYVDCNTYSLEEFVANIKKICSIADIGGIYIDYIQKIRPSKPKEIRESLIQVSSGLQTAAKDLSVPIIVGAQLNRSAANNTGKEETLNRRSKTKHPTLEQLKETGSFEEDANVVIAVYNEYRERSAEDESTPFERGQNTKFIVLKNREGQVNRYVELTFDAVTMQYMNAAEYHINVGQYNQLEGF
jgi:replicative DNA helicase